MAALFFTSMHQAADVGSGTRTGTESISPTNMRKSSGGSNALRVFEILAIGKKSNMSASTLSELSEKCWIVTPMKELFYVFKVKGILKCKVNGDVLRKYDPRGNNFLAPRCFKAKYPQSWFPSDKEMSNLVLSVFPIRATFFHVHSSTNTISFSSKHFIRSMYYLQVDSDPDGLPRDSPSSVKHHLSKPRAFRGTPPPRLSIPRRSRGPSEALPLLESVSPAEPGVFQGTSPLVSALNEDVLRSGNAFR
ncbi:hypothetical protein Fmac_006498 [Flemingia macrophylla]|uniref:Uncharacterized protein n=1 Tax=Flemingia macrophylla TaxID=520843 RepID=A0ABD1NC99_9FABA